MRTRKRGRREEGGGRWWVYVIISIIGVVNVFFILLGKMKVR